MGTMNTPEDPNRPDARQDLPNPEAALGGADSVEKTSYVTGRGTDPDARGGTRADAAPIARVSSGGGIGIGAIILILVVVAIAVIFGAGLFT